MDRDEKDFQEEIALSSQVYEREYTTVVICNGVTLSVDFSTGINDDEIKLKAVLVNRDEEDITELLNKNAIENIIRLVGKNESNWRFCYY